jgi:hypothetical protein
MKDIASIIDFSVVDRIITPSEADVYRGQTTSAPHRLSSGQK